ncbi:MAG TPA: hypothetical protein PLH11_07355 [Gemmobacter sp.]|nr:hypothetical protein [Gemmobacter sp.]
MKALLLILLFGGAAVAVLSPLKAQGDALWGPGFGDLLNGGVAMALMLAALVLALVMKAQMRRAAGGKP